MRANTPHGAVNDKLGAPCYFLSHFKIFRICTNQAQNQIVSPPPGCYCTSPISSLHTLHTHTHTQTGWLLTGTNALMALSYILGTLVSVGNLTHPPWAGGGWGGEGNKMGGRGLSLGCHIHLNSFPVLLLWFATRAASRLDIPVWGKNFPFFSDPESFQINDF